MYYRRFLYNSLPCLYLLITIGGWKSRDTWMFGPGLSGNTFNVFLAFFKKDMLVKLIFFWQKKNSGGRIFQLYDWTTQRNQDRIKYVLVCLSGFEINHNKKPKISRHTPFLWEKEYFKMSCDMKSVSHRPKSKLIRRHFVTKLKRIAKCVWGLKILPTSLKAYSIYLYTYIQYICILYSV